MTSWIPLLTLYECFPEIFDGFELPNSIDKDTLIDNLLVETAELELLFSQPSTLKSLISVWSKKQLPIWNELEKTLNYEYNPIHNYDRTEEHEYGDERNLTGEENRKYTAEETSEGDNNGTSHQGNSLETETEKTGYDSDIYVPVERTTQEGTISGQTTGHETGKFNKTDKDEIGKTEKEITTKKEKIRAYGNIGVTTTQQLIEAQRELVKFNLMDYIIEEFKQRFCILVY